MRMFFFVSKTKLTTKTNTAIKKIQLWDGIRSFWTVDAMTVTFHRNACAANAHLYPTYWVSLPLGFGQSTCIQLSHTALYHCVGTILPFLWFEQCDYIKFYINLCKSATKAPEMFGQDFGKRWFLSSEYISSVCSRWYAFKDIDHQQNTSKYRKTHP